MAEVVYHDPSDRSGVSPFDKVIREITEDREVLIACPYIEPNYLKEVTQETGGWRLLTDVQAWLSIHGRAKREDVREFLMQNDEQVRHVTDLHAKVIISDDYALIGSANFTTKGLTGRTEMSVLIDEEDTIDELTQWYEKLWSIYQPPDTGKIETYIENSSSTPSPARNRSDVSFSSVKSPGKASLSYSDSDDIGNNEDDSEDGHEKLVERVSKAYGSDWIDSYFDLLDDLISATGLPNDDPRLVTSLPQKGTIPVTINNRYVLVAFRGKDNRTEFIIPPDSHRLDVYTNRADYSGRFNSIYGEDESEAPWFIGFDRHPTEAVDREFVEDWIDAACREIDRAEASPYKKHHEPLVYEAARNRDYRRRVIEEAFE